MTPAFAIDRIDAAHARVRGRVGFGEAAAALARGDELFGRERQAIEMDVGGLQAVDSATLAVLLAWAARAARAGVGFRLTGVPVELRALAQLCDAQPLLGIG